MTTPSYPHLNHNVPSMPSALHHQGFSIPEIIHTPQLHLNPTVPLPQATPLKSFVHVSTVQGYTLYVLVI